VFSSPQTNRKGVGENKPNSLLTVSQHDNDKKTLHELEEELSYLKSLPDEKGYLRKNIQDLERQITSFKQEQNFTHLHQIPPKK